jgi:hypothetical protein
MSHGSIFFILIRSANRHATASTLNLLVCRDAGYCWASWRKSAPPVLEHNMSGLLIAPRAREAVLNIASWLEKYVSSDYFYASEISDCVLDIGLETLRARMGNLEVHGCDGFFLHKSKRMPP